MTFTGLSMLAASLAIIIIYLEVPFSVLLAAIVLKDKLGSQRILGIRTSFAGIVLIAGQPTLSERLPAILLTAVGTMTWAVGQIMVKRLENSPSGFTLTAWIGIF